MIFSLAQLTSDQFHSIKDLEEQTGHCIVALRGLPSEPAERREESGFDAGGCE